MVVLLREATLPWVGPVVRELSPEPPWSKDDARVLRVCLTAPELAEVEVGSRVLLRVRPQDATWLNLYRPVVTDRELRLILWADGEATDALQREAVDFFSWIVRVIEVPAATLPEFAVERLRSALQANKEIAWRGPLLAETLRAAGWEQERVELSATMHYEALLDVLKQPGLPIVSGVGSERDVWRVRFALAQVGRDPAWLAVDPAVESTDFSKLGTRQLDWDLAADYFRATGRPHPALLAAWLNLEPTAIEESVGTPAGEQPSRLADLVVRLRELGTDTPGAELVREFASTGFVDVAIQLESLRWVRGDARRADLLVSWLSERGRTREALDVAQKWCERARRDDQLRSLGAAQVALGDISVALGKGEEGRRYFEDALAIARDLVEREPDRSDLRRDLSVLYNRLGDINVALGKGEEARRYFEDALAIARDLVEREPDRSDLRRDLSV
ncbi:MAG: tetratricopeptide repeat protein, partial [Enhygromyxa sp.]